MDRYGNLEFALRELSKRSSHLRYVEVGVFNGVRAAGLLRQWIRGGKDRTAYYAGFDMFETLTHEMSKAELSKAALPPAMQEVRRRLQATVPEAVVELFRGNTRQTLHAYVEHVKDSPRPNLIFLDGGHSLDTIDSDWAAASQLMGEETIMLLDDYYEHRDDYGCGPLVRRLQTDPRWKVELLDPVDHIVDGNKRIRFAKVTLARAA